MNQPRTRVAHPMLAKPTVYIGIGMYALLIISGVLLVLLSELEPGAILAFLGGLLGLSTPALAAVEALSRLSRATTDQTAQLDSQDVKLRSIGHAVNGGFEAKVRAAVRAELAAQSAEDGSAGPGLR